MKVLDITDRLKEQEQPVLKVKGLELPIHDDAIALLTVMELMDGAPTPRDIVRAAKTVLCEEGYEKLATLKLDMDNFMEVINAAVDLVTGEPQGELASLGTTSSMTGI